MIAQYVGRNVPKSIATALGSYSFPVALSMSNGHIARTKPLDVASHTDLLLDQTISPQDWIQHNLSMFGT